MTVKYNETEIRRLMTEYPGLDFGSALQKDVEKKNPGYLMTSFEETSPDPIVITAYIQSKEQVR